MPERVDLDLLLRNLVDYAIFMLDPGGRVLSWNPGAERIKGYSAERIAGRHFSVFYPPEDVAVGRPGQALAIAAAEGRFEDEGWRLRGFGKVTRDLGERRDAERALDERSRLLTHLVRAQEGRPRPRSPCSGSARRP